MKSKKLFLFVLSAGLLVSCKARINVSSVPEVNSITSSVLEEVSSDYQKDTETSEKSAVSTENINSEISSAETSISSNVSSESSGSSSTSSEKGSSISSVTSSASTSVSSSVDSSQSSASSSVSSLSPAVSDLLLSTNSYSEGFGLTYTETSLTGASAYYKLSSASSYTANDADLSRLENNVASVDFVGLKAGTYDFKITSSSGTSFEIKNQVITAYDRSGYAHFNSTSGIGAYNNDGSLKSSAKVLYVTDANKNSVTLTVGSKTYTGLISILQASNSIGYPLDVRIIGTINAATWNKLDYNASSITPSEVVGVNGTALELQNYSESDLISGGFNSLSDDISNGITKLNGLTNKIKYDSSKTEFDSYYNMADISNASNITIEGIGNDAELYQWGFTFKTSNHIEVRNLTFTDYTEDACSFEGGSNTITKGTTSYDASLLTEGNNWVHNNTFNIGKNNWDVCNEQDKHEGDGSTDIKYTRDITFSYNHYVKTHKTGLVGGSDNQLTANITFHHNYYDSCQSRLPFARQANMHMYNNYYSGSTNNNMQIYAGAYAFIEGCYFENVKNTFTFDDRGYTTPAIKSYNNIFSSCANTSGATIVTSRDATVENGNVFNQNFDTDSSAFYYDATNNVSNVTYLSSAEQAKSDCVAYAGTYKPNVVPASSEASSGDDSGSTDEEKTTVTFNAANYDVGTYTEAFGDDTFSVNASSSASISVAAANYYTKFNSGYTAEIKLGGSATTSTKNISFTMPKDGTIKIYARSANTTTARSLAIYKADGTVYKTFDAIITATELSSDLTAGSYYIGSTNSGMNIGAIVLTY